jgi:PilZ domain-containing protein
MAEPCTVIIGAEEHLDSLKRHTDSNDEVLAFRDEDALAALAAITTRSPQVIILERLFAATARGTAFINRLKADAGLSSVEIRMVSHDGSYTRVSLRRAPLNPLAPREDKTPASMPATATPPSAHLDYHGTRRSQRFRLHEGTEVQLEGSLAKIVDLSPIGAQVLSQQPLKPQQRIRIVLADDLGMVRVNAAVAWASFEIPKGASRYRAGIEFKDAEPKAVEAFCMRHKK